jgi:hypothetical protein
MNFLKEKKKSGFFFWQRTLKRKNAHTINNSTINNSFCKNRKIDFILKKENPFIDLLVVDT